MVIVRMGEHQAKAKIALEVPGKRIEVEALFDTGSSRSVISLDLARELGCYRDFPADWRYKLGTARQGDCIWITGRCDVVPVLHECRIPPSSFEVSPDLPPGRVIIGRPEIDSWGIIFTPEGPKLKKCPPEMEII